ncbi:hypothetical protein CEV33_3663 [Brucella grignonensis]|uniref:Uncharacterized protein n=1 Tax=Brucella grignonensis TaxID=94627 RepID=A0A256EYM5_9HYPH|nr:hypothetical protein CEV33_3663 [Brucella grignonensis]
MAVRADNTLPVLLDDQFERLDLTSAERAGIQQVLTSRLAD